MCLSANALLGYNQPHFSERTPDQLMSIEGSTTGPSRLNCHHPSDIPLTYLDIGIYWSSCYSGFRCGIAIREVLIWGFCVTMVTVEGFDNTVPDCESV